MRKALFIALAAGLLATACGSGLETAHAPTVIPWERAEELILAGEVRDVVRIDATEVRLGLRDGRRVLALEPSPEEVVRVIQKCGEPCAGVTMR